MHLLLLESDRSFLRSAECAAVSIMAHAGVVWLGVAMTEGGRQLPADEREARVFFLLPPDRAGEPQRQSEVFQLGKVGGELDGGIQLTGPGDGMRVGARSYGPPRWGERSRTRGEVPFGPVPRLLPDSIFSVLEVDEMVERYDESAAPAYPRELAEMGIDGQVQATYVVDTTGGVDPSTIQVLHSDDPRFTESVLNALGGMRFRPAKRAGKVVRQLVEQRFRFRIASPYQAPDRIS
jgi:TonB family protein